MYLFNTKLHMDIFSIATQSNLRSKLMYGSKN